MHIKKMHNPFQTQINTGIGKGLFYLKTVGEKVVSNGL